MNATQVISGIGFSLFFLTLIVRLGHRLWIVGGTLTPLERLLFAVGGGGGITSMLLCGFLGVDGGIFGHRPPLWLAVLYGIFACWLCYSSWYGRIQVLHKHPHL